MFTCTKQLNQEQLMDVEQLISSCQACDGSSPNVYPHILSQQRALPANVLYYKDHQLLGFISAYFFYEDAVEVSILVEPSARRKGLGYQLLQSILPTIHSQNVKKLIFSCPHIQHDDWLKGLGFAYQNSEYHMERHDLQPELITNPSLSFKKAKLKDIEDLCLIDEVCFPKEHSKMTRRFRNLLNDRNYLLLLTYQDGKPIGKAHIRWHQKGATFSDIGIVPELQGKGLGGALLAYCINSALSEGKSHLDLDVETRNINALNLYTRFGFKVKNACDYWSIDIEQLPQEKLSGKVN